MLPRTQADLFPDLAGRPEGLRYEDAFLSATEEDALMAELSGLAFRPFEFRGVLARRQVAYFGYAYDFGAGRLSEAPAIPEFLLPIRARAAAFAGLEPRDLPHVLVNKYEPGAALGWHRDRPQFADVIGVSIGAPGTFRMRRRRSRGWERFTFTVQARSIYLLRGPSRREWEHSLPASPDLRYSITFRSLADANPPRG